MKKPTAKQQARPGKVGTRPTGVFKRIADAERQSGAERIVHNTSSENAKS
jgi:hypothetical protein